jgi:hypothetical protein
MESATDALQEVTGESGWQFVGFHDLDTFLDHYRGTHTPEAQRREREKVDWLWVAKHI